MGRTILVAILLLYGGGQGSWVAAQDSPPAISPLASDAGHVPHEEALDEIALDRVTYFLTPDGTDATAPPGLYRVVVVEPARLRLIPANGSDALLLQAFTMHHQKKIAEPVALSIPGRKDTYHVVLLLPNGRGLDASGSYGAVRPRGWNPTPLLLEWIEKALTQKQTPIRKDEKKGGH